jgi:nicotinate-nucleotide adenylyltransferase
VQDIEAKYARATSDGVIETADTLRCLTRDFPDYRFIWTMGADNFVTFHTWGHSQYILDNFPISVMPRQGYNEEALNSISASRLPRLDKAADMKWSNGWYMLDGEGSDIAATHCRKELEAGQVPKCMRPEVANYALVNHVYIPR